MNNQGLAHVVNVASDSIRFSDGSLLYSVHDQECCEHHYLDFSHSVEDFEGLLFDLSSADFFEKVPDYGIRLKPVNGFPIPVPGYGSNNGYYSANLTLVLTRNGAERTFDVTACQVSHG